MRWGILALTLTLVGGQISQEVRDAIDARLTDLETSMYSMARQLMMQRLDMEETMRSDGDSGVKQVRNSRDGNRAFYGSTHVRSSQASIHDHTELIQTCGMGEIEAVLNGVHFRTRHNDYKLKQPHSTETGYHATENVQYPPVPPEVANQTNLEEASRVLRSYFRAWLDSDSSTLDYHPYFRPMMCYLEGAWTTDIDLDEPFDSDRHHIDASSWFDLQEKVRFTAATGDKDQLENFAYLPTAIVNITGGLPVVAQWNYRILCHPIQGDLLEIKHLKANDDLHSRVVYQNDLDKWLSNSRRGRYVVAEHDTDRFDAAGSSLLDRIMSQVPGKDNYAANITDDGLGRLKYDVTDDQKLLNAGYYHRYYSTRDNDAMGVNVLKRGFGDRNLYVAYTNQPRVVPQSLTDCDRSGNNCNFNKARVTYAIPLEIVWTTPLNSWNPFEIEYIPGRRSSVEADGRDGSQTVEKAFNGSHDGKYFLTPASFFTGGEFETDAADTVPGAVGVLDKWGNVRALKASGIRIFLPEILDVGNVRTRYPIFPSYAEGNFANKELSALEKIVMDLEGNSKYLKAMPEFGVPEEEMEILPDPDLTWYKLQTSPSEGHHGYHIHSMDMSTKHALYAMDGCEVYTVRTSSFSHMHDGVMMSHSHLLTVHYNQTSHHFEYLTCDGMMMCFDHHPPHLSPYNPAGHHAHSVHRRDEL